MKHIAAYLLLTLGGNTHPSAADITALLAEVGIDADAAQLTKVLIIITCVCMYVCMNVWIINFL